MPRPCKRRRVCALPRFGRFGPVNGPSSPPPVLAMTLDEFETLRLIDLEGFTQAQCAQQMNVARTTVQAIYDGARRKVAQCLVGGMELQIAGGDYVLCEGGHPCCCGRPCTRHLKQTMPGQDSRA